MSENNYGALMLKSALDTSVDVTKIIAPGIYPVITGNASAPDSVAGLLTVAPVHSGSKVTFQKQDSSVAYALINGKWEKPTASDVDALAKSQNGGDVPQPDWFVRNIGAARAFSGSVSIGGNSEPWTTAEFIVWLENQGAFNHPYWMCKGSWTYAANRTITDTGCGNLNLTGAVVEVMGLRDVMTIRVTTPTTTAGDGIASAQFTYINHGEGYSPGWRRDLKRSGDEMTGPLKVNGDITATASVITGNGTGRLADNGNIYGTVWGGEWLSNWLSNAFASRDNNINTRATWDWVSQTFVSDIRLGSRQQMASTGANEAPSGFVSTGGYVYGNWDNSADGWYIRPIQKLINGTWYNVVSI